MSGPTPASAAAHAASPITRLRTAWHAISPRERRLVSLAGGVLGIAAVVGLLDWSQTERARLERTLPRAEASLEQVQEAATEIARLRTLTPPARPSGPALLDAVQASAKARGLPLTVQAGGEGIQIKGQAGFDALTGWLATLQKDQGLRVRRMEIQPQGDQAGIDALLVGPDGG
jgi:general secretion pathway protein M